MNYVTVTTEATPEVIEVDGVSVIYTPGDLQVVEVTAPGEIVTEHWTEAEVLESCAQGPPGPPGAAGGSYPAKHLTYTDGEVSEVLLYSDAAATQLAERRVIARAGGNVTGITYFDGAGVTLHTRTFTYTDGVLISIADH